MITTVSSSVPVAVRVSLSHVTSAPRYSKIARMGTSVRPPTNCGGTSVCTNSVSTYSSTALTDRQSSSVQDSRPSINANSFFIVSLLSRYTNNLIRGFLLFSLYPSLHISQQRKGGSYAPTLSLRSRVYFTGALSRSARRPRRYPSAAWCGPRRSSWLCAFLRRSCR